MTEQSNGSAALPDPVWWPERRYVEGTRLAATMAQLRTPDYAAFLKTSVEDPERFWAATAVELRFRWRRPHDRFLDLCDGPELPRFFAGAELNIIDSALQRPLDEGRADDVAIIAVDEAGTDTIVSHRELHERVARAAAHLAAAGVRRGTPVGLYLPYTDEAAVALLAVAWLGAIAVPVFTGYGREAVAVRLRDAGAQVVVTTDGFVRKGKWIALRDTLHAAVGDCPDVRRVIDVGTPGWRDGDGDVPTASLSPQDPLLLAYTSGTTGRPKGTVHTHAGLPLKVAQEMAQLMDLRTDRRLLRITDLGWVAGPYTILSGLTVGATIVMLSGAPTHPDPAALWSVVERHRVTHLSVAPTLVRMLRAAGDEHLQRHDRDSLQMLMSTAEPWDHDSYMWFFDAVGGRRLPIINHSGGTEVGNLLGCVPLRPIRPCGFNTAVPGVDVAVFDERGERVVEQTGELVVREPFVGMTQGLWRDEQRYRETYWSTFPGVWAQGDRAIEHADGSWTLEGRTDDRIKVAGRSVTPTETEALAVQDPAVKEAALIGVPDPVTGARLVLFLVCDDAPETTAPRVLEELQRTVGKSTAPALVHCVSQLPRTPSGKLRRKALRDVYLGGDPDEAPANGAAAWIDDVRLAASI